MLEDEGLLPYGWRVADIVSAPEAHAHSMRVVYKERVRKLTKVNTQLRHSIARWEERVRKRFVFVSPMVLVVLY